MPAGWDDRVFQISLCYKDGSRISAKPSKSEKHFENLVARSLRKYFNGLKEISEIKSKAKQLYENRVINEKEYLYIINNPELIVSVNFPVVEGDSFIPIPANSINIENEGGRSPPTFENSISRRKFLKVATLFAGLLITNPSYAFEFKEDTPEARKKRLAEKKVREKLLYRINNIPPIINEYTYRNGKEYLEGSFENYKKWSYSFENRRRSAMYLGMLKSQIGDEDVDNEILAKAKYEPGYLMMESIVYHMFFRRGIDDLIRDDIFEGKLELEINPCMKYFDVAVGRLTGNILFDDYSYKSGEEAIKNAAYAVFEVYNEGKGKELGEQFYKANLDTKKEMINDILIPQIKEKGTLDELLGYKDPKDAPLLERKIAFYNALKNFDKKYDYETQLEYMKDYGLVQQQFV